MRHRDPFLVVAAALIGAGLLLSALKMSTSLAHPEGATPAAADLVYLVPYAATAGLVLLLRRSFRRGSVSQERLLSSLVGGTDRRQVREPVDR
ncbi:hypothetical protein [Nostocoides australiense]|nr:hypothetical protein [Tetrasphaera australiensis]